MEKFIDKNVLKKYIKEGGHILEVGPGAGRWTEILQPMAEILFVVDTSDQCIEICKEKFTDFENMQFFTNNGTDLPFIDTNSLDFVWSFDVFVHINSEDVAEYFREFKRTMKVGRGRGNSSRTRSRYSRRIEK